MANQEHVDLIKQGIANWNSLRKQNYIESPDLKKVDLRGIDLSGADLNEAELTEGNLSKATLFRSNLSKADLSGVNLSNADLRWANLVSSNLSKSNLRNARLSNAILNGGNLGGADLSGAKLIYANLNGANLRKADLSGANFTNAYLGYADLSGAVLKGAVFSSTCFSRANLRSTNFRKINFSDTDLRGVNFSGADLRGANMSNADLRGANMSKADLRGANLIEADIEEADLRRATLVGANLSGANLCSADVRWANFRNANLQRSDFSDAINYGTDFKGADLRDVIVSENDPNSIDFSGEDLSGADFSGANLSNADLRYADLSGANLFQADLSKANLSEAYLNEACLRNTEIIGADLSLVDLSGANLSEANLSGVNLSSADLSDTDITDADLSESDLSGANLTEANLSKTDLTGANLLDANLNDVNLNNENFNGTNLTGTDLKKSILNQAPQEIVYSFEEGFDSIDTIAMDYTKVALNNSHPEYNLRLESLTLCGQPKAIFSVAGKDFVEQAKTQIDRLFQIQREEFGVIVDEAVESITKAPGDSDESAIKDDKSGDKARSVDLNFACKKFDSSILAYDSYWKEYTCVKCGWIYADANSPRDNNKPVESRKEPVPNRSEIQPYDSVFSFSRLNLFKKRPSVFSFSRLNLFKNCPKAYRFKYILKKKETFSTIEQHLGKCVHKTLEYAYSEISNQGIPSKRSIIEKYNMAWDTPNLNSIKVVKLYVSADYYKLEGANMLSSYFDNILINDISETVELEKKFEIELNSNIGFRGIIDRISWSSNKVLRITDFKTGKRVGNPATDNQLKFYSLWAFDTFKENEIEVCFEDLRNKKTKTAKISREQILQIEKDLIKDVKRVGAERYFKPKPSILCNWCGYNRICNDALSYRL